jgi:uncharacterized protein YodC (DUF2158 family)
MSNGIKAGDVVRLNSGGPIMTVAEVEEWKGVMRAQCHWFVGGKKQVDYFPLSSLKVEENRSEPITVEPYDGGDPSTSWMR